ncbi:MAG: hypothetical protein SF162_01155 [bacterium]|nr:hypothetical protein [bacterium]
MLTYEQPYDLRDVVEEHLGKPLAASTHAALWRCPACPPERHALIMVSAHECKCLSGYPCDGGADEWMHSEVPEPDEPFLTSVLA